MHSIEGSIQWYVCFASSNTPIMLYSEWSRWSLSTNTMYIGSRVFRDLTFGEGSGPIFLDRVTCSSKNVSLFECDSNPVGVHTCTHSQDVAVQCFGTNEPTYWRVWLSFYFIDYNECVVNNGDCDQLCYNLIPGHQCGCEDGYVLQEDNQTCTGYYEIVTFCMMSLDCFIFRCQWVSWWSLSR